MGPGSGTLCVFSFPQLLVSLRRRRTHNEGLPAAYPTFQLYYIPCLFRGHKVHSKWTDIILRRHYGVHRKGTSNAAHYTNYIIYNTIFRKRRLKNCTAVINENSIYKLWLLAHLQFNLHSFPPNTEETINSLYYRNGCFISLISCASQQRHYKPV